MNSSSDDSVKHAMEEIRTEKSWARIHRVEGTIPVVFLHGYPLDSSMWRSQIEYFRSMRTTIEVDFRGFGKSASREAQQGSATLSGLAFTMASLADDCIDVVSAFGIAGRVVVCGLSMGGYVALEVWNRHVDRVAALLFVDTRATADAPEAAAQRLKSADQAIAEGTEVVVRPMLPKLLAPDNLKNAPLAEEVVQMMTRVPPTTIASALRAMANRQDFMDVLHQIAVPTLLIVGELDAITPPAEMQRMADRIPGSILRIVAQAGHMAPMENPPQFNSYIEEFLITHGSSKHA